ncbi:hypothetical protein ACQJBY_032878 [Aegilops geniculata]
MLLPGPMMAMWPCTWVLVNCSAQRNGRFELMWHFLMLDESTSTGHTSSRRAIYAAPCSFRALSLLIGEFRAVSHRHSFADFSRRPKLDHPLLPSTFDFRQALVLSAAKADGHGRRQPGDDGQRAEGVPVRAGAQGAGPRRHEELMVQRLPLQPQLCRRGGQGRRPLVRLRAHHAPGLLPLQAPPPERHPARRRRSRARAAHG